jgi:hypothetical protein
MTEPTRLVEMKADDFRERLLRAASDDAPAEGAHGRAHLALGFAPIGAGAAPLVHSASKSLFTLFAKWAGIGALAGAVTSTIAGHTFESLTSGERISRARSAAPAPSPARVTGAAAPSNTQAAELPATDAPPATGATAILPAASAARAQQKPSDSLADELRMVDAAREALSAGNPGEAIAALDRYRSRYPRARLGDESTALRIEALLARGSKSEAVALAHRFLSAHPTSPLAQRVRTLVGR